MSFPSISFVDAAQMGYGTAALYLAIQIRRSLEDHRVRLERLELKVFRSRSRSKKAKSRGR